MTIALWHALPPQFEEQLAAVAGLASAYHFDDGHDDVLRAADALEVHGLRGVFFVITSRIDTPGWISDSQIDELSERGHEIGNHTWTHPWLTRVSPERARAEIEHAQLDLIDRLGIRPRRFAWPHGAHDRQTYSMAQDFGFVEIRDISNVVKHAARKTPADVLADM